MGATVYLVRSSVDEVSPSLYSESENAIIVILEKSSSAGKILKSAAGCSWEKGARLSYRDLLELLLRSQRVITL